MNDDLTAIKLLNDDLTHFAKCSIARRQAKKMREAMYVASGYRSKPTDDADLAGAGADRSARTWAMMLNDPVARDGVEAEMSAFDAVMTDYRLAVKAVGASLPPAKKWKALMGTDREVVKDLIDIWPGCHGGKQDWSSMALDVTTFEDGNGDLIADARAVISRLCADHSDPSHVIAPSDSQIDSRETTVIPALVEPPAAENDRPRPKPVAMAVALLKDHPDWSARKLAAAAGCHHTTLTRSTFFNRAKGITSSGHERNRGSKSADGRIEAEDNSAADEIDAIDEAIDSAEKPQRTTSRTTDD